MFSKMHCKYTYVIYITQITRHFTELYCLGRGGWCTMCNINFTKECFSMLLNYGFFRLGKGIITQEVIVFIKFLLMSLNVFGRNNMGVNSVNICLFQQVICFSDTKKSFLFFSN